MTKRRVAAVIVHYGDPQRTIRAVLNHSKLGVFSDIIVIANDLSERPRELKDNPCEWLIPTRNLGFGGACQVGARACTADVYAFFNAHTTMDRSSVDHCAAIFDIEDVGIAAPYLYHPHTTTPSVNWSFAHGVRTYSPILHLPILKPEPSCSADHAMSQADPIDVDWATGSAIFCRYEVIRDVGWDGSYFLGFEDVDIATRAKKRGWRVVIVPSATAFHSGESTRRRPASAYYDMRNALWFARRHHRSRTQALLTAYLLLLLCRIAVADLVKLRRPTHVRPAAQGILSGWILWPDGTDPLPGEPLWPRGHN
jgi:N-acetylglucosaminyl-diphospho-decaprenol L-rhamnosyltransferase